MVKIKRCWALTKACWGILISNKKLFAFPLMGLCGGLSILGIILMALSFAGIPISTPLEEIDFISKLYYLKGSASIEFFTLNWRMIIGLMGVAILMRFLTLIWSSAMIFCILKSLEGEKPTLAEGLRAAYKRKGTLFAWMLISMGIGFILRFITRLFPSLLGRILDSVAVLTWEVGTFFVVPIIIFEETNLVTAIRKSAQLIKNTWGEQTTFKVGFQVIMCLIMMTLTAGICAYILIPYKGIVSPLHVLDIQFLMNTGLVLSPFFLIIASVQVVFEAVLYVYTVTGLLPQEFPHDLIPNSGVMGKEGDHGSIA